MSGKLAMQVLESALPSKLKPTAVTLALFADTDGGSIFPSVARVAHLIGKSDRQVRSDVTALIGAGVLLPLSARTGGKGHTTRYRLTVAALPIRPPWEPRSKPGSPLPPLDSANPEAHFRVGGLKGGSGAPETWKCEDETRKSTAPNPEAHFRRSVSDPSEDQKEKKSPASPDSSTWKEKNDQAELARRACQRIVATAKQILQIERLDIDSPEALTAEILARFNGDAGEVTVVAAAAGLAVEAYVGQESLMVWTGHKLRLLRPVPVADGSAGC